ncbi:MULTISPECIES: SDR family NAD(P)-dependent oxidoreductase [Actinomadura]|uniref:SDR family NAD(P)-dependent oxidoreductase n=1 Tax=Actinomadura yumaensis TaxID=111807 RepID=A0ABW2CTD8_9ACTN|nr:SDR family NAD(P)-dependent oxidoreductase [Actinomadura sp. J1-007]MWK35233.1 SDR family NAD(P)-dependent oxidoreductase [Actinomadura sp. J1-007]
MELRGANVLLTGASGGIGRALAEAFAARGAEVVLSGRRTEVLEPLAERIGGRVVAADLAERDAPEELLAEAGPVDVLVANAALPASGLLSGYALDEVDRALDVNLRAPIVMAKLAGARMADRGRGHARATVRAVERDVAEIDVAPLGLRLGALVGGAAPALVAAVQRRAGGGRITRDLAAGQRGRR